MLMRMRQQVILAFSLLATSVYAVEPGFYMGLMTGSATNTATEQQAQVEGSATTTPATPESTQYGTRIFMGYKINRFVGVEGGYTYFSTINYDTKGVDTCSSANARVQDADLVLKGSVPLRKFELFGKVGAAVAYTTTSGALNPDLSGDCGDSKNEVGYRATYSAGVSYELSQSWVADLSWTRVAVGGVINNMDLYALGISYHFVQVYCGQFLCD